MTLLLVVLAQVAALSGAPKIPYESGLRLSFAESISGEPDFEGILSLTSVEPEAATVRLSWNRGADRRWKSIERPLSRRERQLGRSFYHYGKEGDDNEFRGFALAMTTQAVLKNLKEKGSAEVAFLLPEAARTPYRGILTRVGTTDPFKVLVDGKEVSLPGIRARGKLINPTSEPGEVTAEFLFLDDADAAWMLETSIKAPSSEGRKRLVRIATRASEDALEAELRDRCRASVHDLFFATASVDMDAASAPALARIAEILTANPDWRITLLGHTDSIGTPESNLDLSQRRAETVVRLLTGDHGIAPQRMKAEGRGETQPLANNGTAEGRARNRRVELARACG